MQLRTGFCVFLCLSASVALLHPQTAKRAITLDDVVAQHRAAPITAIWSPDGASFAFQQSGVVHLFNVAQKADRDWFRTDALAKLAKPPAEPHEFGWQNRRVSPDTYQWFPDGKDLLASVSGDLFIVHPDGKFDQITRTDFSEEDPKLSPDGHLVAYRSNSNLYLLNIATKKIRQLTSNGTSTLLNGQLDWVYPEELDLGTAIWWAPDSKSLAYFQFDVSKEFMYPQTDLLGERAIAEPERYPQAGTPNANVRLGVVAAKGGATSWMNLGETADALLARVEWLPDSSAIAVERLNRVQNKLDLVFCNPKSGVVRTVLQESSKTWINVVDNLRFLHSKPEFLWTSERTGFRHLYRYSDDGRLLAQLTDGNWEVSTIAAVDEQRNSVYFTSSEATPLESQLYRVSFSGGARSQLTAGGANHQIQANPSGAYYLDTFSSLTRPPETDLRSSEGDAVATVRPANLKPLEEFDILPTEVVHVTAPDGTLLYATLIKPAGFEPGKKYPAIVYVYGGPGVQSIRNAWPGISLEQYWAHHGYVVWQLDNRGSNGRGHAFEEPIYHELGKQEVTDQQLGVEHLISMGFVDPNRIGIHGWSYGGYMTIHCLLLVGDLFKVGVAGAPVTDWHNYDTIYTERYMGLPEQNRAGYDASSNVKNAQRLQGKLLIVHNFEDDNVLFQNTMQMVDALENAGKQYDMQIYPQKTHGVSGPLRRPLYQAMTAFFDSHLKNAN